MVKKFIDAWCRFWIAIGPLGGIVLAVYVPNIIEAYMHDVSVYDATFIESWKTAEEYEDHGSESEVDQ